MDSDEKRLDVSRKAPVSEPVLPRVALERVLARATELQSAGADAPEAITESRLIEVAHEVGIDVNHVRQAIAEERARGAFDDPGGGFLLDRMGPAMLHSQRTVPGDAGAVQARIEAWMPRVESMVLRRKMPQRVSWEPRKVALADALRVVTSGGRSELVRADQVSATVSPVDDNRSVVRFDVELSALRKSQRNLAFGLGVVMNAVVFAMWSAPVLLITAGSPNDALVAAGVATIGAAQVGAGFGIWRAFRNSYRKTLTRVQLRVDQMLDELETGGLKAPPSLLTQVRGALLGDQNSSR